MTTALTEAAAEVLSRAERTVLGAAMCSATAAASVVADLGPADLVEPKHRVLLRAYSALAARGSDISVTTVHDEMVRGGAAVDAPWLFGIYECAPPVPSQISGAMEIVRREAERRRVLETGVRLQQLAESHDFETADVVARAQAELDVVQRVGTDGPVQAGELAQALLERLEDGTDAPAEEEPRLGIPTGFEDLDRVLHLMRAGQLIVVGARPAVGKSVFGLNIARNAAVRLGHPSLLFSLEMSRLEIVERLIAAEARISLHLIQNGKLDDWAWDRIGKAMPALLDAPLYIDDTPDLSVAQLRARARQSRQRHSTKLVVVDYLQLLTAGRRSENRQSEVAEMSRGLKLAAKQLEIPIVVLAQLNRAVEQRTNKRPMLSDLRESGAVEQDADVVLFLSRNVQAPHGSPEADEAEVIVAKQRNGPTGDVQLAWQGYYARFADMARPGVSAPVEQPPLVDPELWAAEAGGS